MSLALEFCSVLLAVRCRTKDRRGILDWTWESGPCRILSPASFAGVHY